MELYNLTIEEAAAGLRAKKFSSVELTESCLERIRKTENNLHAFINIFADEALAAARLADKMLSQGVSSPLTGVPLALKDNLNTKGLPTTAGSRILETYLPPYDATAVLKLKSAGAVILGKTNMDEFAMGSSTETSYFGPTRNPWNLETVPGGSSGGSAAAVSADCALAALGSDTGGSIRQPASFCGVVGLKPTYGRVSRYGLMAMASSLDQIGPIAKTVKDAAILFAAISGPDKYDATLWNKPADKIDLKNTEIRGLKLGLPREFFSSGMDVTVEKTVREAVVEFEKMGAKIKEVDLPTSRYALAVYYIVMPAEVSANLARYDGIRFGYSSDAKNLFDCYVHSRLNGFGEEVRRRIMLGTYVLSAGYYEAFYGKAQKARTLIRRDFDAAFLDVDALITPTSPFVAFNLGEKFDDPLTMYLSDIYTVSVNIAGLPSISVPCGFAHGLPVGLQLIGKAFDEATILRAAAAYESSTDWHTKKPRIGK